MYNAENAFTHKVWYSIAQETAQGSFLLIMNQIMRTIYPASRKPASKVL